MMTGSNQFLSQVDQFILDNALQSEFGGPRYFKLPEMQGGTSKEVWLYFWCQDFISGELFLFHMLDSGVLIRINELNVLKCESFCRSWNGTEVSFRTIFFSWSSLSL